MCNKEPHPFLQLNFLAAQGSILPCFKFLPQLLLPLFLLDSDLLPFSWRIGSPKHCLKSSQTVPYLFPIYMDPCSTFWASIHTSIHKSIQHTYIQPFYNLCRTSFPSFTPKHPKPPSTTCAAAKEKKEGLGRVCSSSFGSLERSRCNSFFVLNV